MCSSDLKFIYYKIFTTSNIREKTDEFIRIRNIYDFRYKKNGKWKISQRSYPITPSPVQILFFSHLQSSFSSAHRGEKSKQKQQITSAHIGCLCKVIGGCISKGRYGNLNLHNFRSLEPHRHNCPKVILL